MVDGNESAEREDLPPRPRGVAELLVLWRQQPAASRAHVALLEAVQVARSAQATDRWVSIAERVEMPVRVEAQSAGAAATYLLSELLFALAKEADGQIDPTYLDHFKPASAEKP